jgi:dethiobiotin synthetase
MARGLFITGTGTGVGKTYVACLIARALMKSGKRVGVYKPAASGGERDDHGLVSPDAFALWDAAGRPGTLQQVCPQVFAAPLAPHLAAREEGREINRGLLRSGIAYWNEASEIVLVEGAGGLMSPLGDHDYNADLAAEFGFPLVIVAANALGTINATLQTLITARHHSGGLNVVAVVLNSPTNNADDPSTMSNAEELRKRCDVPLLAEVAHGGQFAANVDWWAQSI